MTSCAIAVVLTAESAKKAIVRKIVRIGICLPHSPISGVVFVKLPDNRSPHHSLSIPTGTRIRAAADIGMHRFVLPWWQPNVGWTVV
jgi:hypothetical protein